MKIAVIGLGFVGLTLSSVLASKGITTVGIDLDKEKCEKIIDQILNKKKPKPGSYRGRTNSEPENNRKTLMNIKNAWR